MSGKRGSFIQPSFSFAIESYIFVCNWFYTWPLSKISFLSPLITCSKLTFRGCSDRWLQTRSIFSHLNYVQSTFWQLGNDSKWFQTIFFFEQILWNISFKLFPFFSLPDYYDNDDKSHLGGLPIHTVGCCQDPFLRDEASSAEVLWEEFKNGVLVLVSSVKINDVKNSISSLSVCHPCISQVCTRRALEYSVLIANQVPISQKTLKMGGGEGRNENTLPSTKSAAIQGKECAVASSPPTICWAGPGWKFV